MNARSVLSLLLALIASSLAFAFGSGLPASYAALPGNVAHEDALLQHTNHVRAAAGLAPLQRDDALTLAARHHASEMAALRYMSHESPTPENARLAQRLARAGSGAQTAAENLARVRDDANAARVSVDGWMASPGHRANLLDRRFTHVGFGTAPGASGELYVVQVLAYQPLRPLGAQVATVAREVPHVEVSFELLVPRDVLVGYGEAFLPPASLAAGRHVVRIPHEEALPVHIRAGTRVATAEGGFIGQDGGWFDPAAGTWRGSGTFPRQELRIEAVALRATQQVSDRVALTFAEPVPADVAVWVQGSAHPARAEGNRIELEVPHAPQEIEIRVGVPMGDGSGRYVVALGLALRGGGAGRSVHAVALE